MNVLYVNLILIRFLKVFFLLEILLDLFIYLDVSCRGREHTKAAVCWEGQR